MFFQGLLKVPSQWALWGALFQILQIFEDFGIPLGLPFGTIFPQKVGSETEAKKDDFLDAGGRGRDPRVGMIRNWSYPSTCHASAQGKPGAAYSSRQACAPPR